MRELVNNPRFRNLFISLILALAIYFLPCPAGLSLQAWKMFALFVGTIFIIVTDALPMGAATLLGLAACIVTNTLTFESAFAGYTHRTTWLILLAFFIAHGIIDSGLGNRLAYHFVRLLGRRTLGLGYGIACTELMLAPAIPSVTARSGGIVYPIVRALAAAFDSHPNSESAKKIGSYLILVAYQTTAVTSAMFLTAMAGSPLAQKLAHHAGIEITWGNWALFASVPGAVCLLLLPWLMMRLAPPELRETPGAVDLAKEKLREMGSLRREEKWMLLCLVFLLSFWMLEGVVGVSSVLTALLGVVFLLVIGVVRWRDLLAQTSAWDTFIWFGALVAMADGLNSLGLTTWFGAWASSHMGGLSWGVAALVMFLIYYYSHYFFASSTAHIGALYLPLLLVTVHLGAPPLVMALLFGAASSLMGGITHYGMGPAPILFGAGYVSLKEWWKIGFIFSVVNIVVWLVIGGLWWKLLGMW